MKVQPLNAEAPGRGLNALYMFLLGFNSSVHLCSPNIAPVPKWALIAVAVAVGVLLLLFLICIVRCCCGKKKPKKKERVSVPAVSSSTTASLVRLAFPSPPPPSSLRSLLPCCLVLGLVGARHGWGCGGARPEGSATLCHRSSPRWRTWSGAQSRRGEESCSTP